jgi:tetratricopeptide (TPR) repeat protein
VLDDAAGESQLRPLLPGTPPAAVLITSRRRLGGLAGASHVEVGVLDAETSLALLGRIAGTGRVRAQPGAAARVAGQCGHLPLALRVAGARLAERPHWDIQQLADRLADETRRLDELRHGDLAVRASISLTHDSASQQARRLLRRLALVQSPAFSGWLAAALLGQSPAEAEDALDELVSARLVETTGTGTGVHSQYRMHDLIRVYARERLAADEPPAEQDAALERALGALLYLAEEADRRYYGGDQLQINSDATRWPLPGQLTGRILADPLTWLERERAALVAGVRQAARAGFTDVCWSLVVATETVLKSRAYLDDVRETHEIALRATRRAGHVRGQATILCSRGSLFIAQQEYTLAREDLTAAAQLFQDSGDDHGLARADAHIAFLDRVTGRLEEAARRAEQALAVLRRTGDRLTAAYALQNLAAVRLQSGELGPATDFLSEALRLAQAAGARRSEAQVLTRLGETYLQAGEPARGLDTFEHALANVRALKDQIGEAHILHGIGVAKTRLGEFGNASTALQRSLELATGVGERLAAARALLGLGELALARDDPGQAVVLAGQAADAFGKLGARPDELRALTLLSDASTALNDTAAASAAAARADGLRAKLTHNDAPRLQRGS